MRVTIIGIGNVGCALAVDLESRGHTALLWADPAYRTTLDTIRTAQQLSSIGIIAGTFRPQPVESLEDAIASSKIVIIATPSAGHDSVLVELAKHDLRAHTVIAISGNFFSLVATKRINARAILETVSSPFGCRLTGDGQTVFVKSMKARLDIAAASRIPDAALQDEIGEVFRAPLAWCANAVELALMCFNGVIHPAAALLNVARIETAPDFFFYCEGMSRSVTKVQEAVDAERIRIANALGFAPEAWLQAYKTIYGTTYPDVATLVADRTIAHNMTKGAPSGAVGSAGRTSWGAHAKHSCADRFGVECNRDGLYGDREKFEGAGVGHALEGRFSAEVQCSFS
ncbi:NAD/NADP octopine/nopaline dehydrogenase [Mycena crocata]|nr:NAD/NADP octopine/nopaline dehydrogenase [Mycena crocata]